MIGLVRKKHLRSVLAASIGAVFATFAFAQRVTVLTPDGSSQSVAFAEQLVRAFEQKLRVTDTGVARSAFDSVKTEDPFNLTAEQARSIGTVIGCDYFVLVKAATARRSSSARPAYYEAYAAIYLVNSRTGFLDQWTLESKQGETAAEAERSLFDTAPTVANQLAAIVRGSKPEVNNGPEFELFDPHSKTARPTMPYKRIKPEYTSTAYMYEIAATVEAELSVDDKGNIRRIDIVRWAGYGLDEAVISAIRQMNWRPGERGGKPLPMRVLLRYNFTKIEKE